MGKTIAEITSATVPVALRLESAPKVAQARLAVNDLLRLLAALDLRPRTAVTASRRQLHDLLVVVVGVFITALLPWLPVLGRVDRAR